MGQNDRFEDSSERTMVVLIVLGILFFLIVFVSYKRRYQLAPKICPMMCAYNENEAYQMWDMTDWGIKCLCRGSLTPKRRAIELRKP
jgi:hypothetical protein